MAVLMFQWTGEAMQPLPHFRKQAALLFKPGVSYQLVEVDRNMKSHEHFFACIADAHANLREDMMQRWPTPEHLRKWALTHTPFCDVRHFHASSKAEALRVAKYLSGGVDYSRIEIHGDDVTQFIPQSQALVAMPENRIFMQSKRAVLEVLAKHLGVSLEELESAGRAA